MKGFKNLKKIETIRIPIEMNIKKGFTALSMKKRYFFFEKGYTIGIFEAVRKSKKIWRK
jgi:hypothetical protein